MEAMMSGARKIIQESLGLQESENLVVLVDRPNRASGEALRKAAEEQHAEVSLIEIESRTAHAMDPPRPAAAALRETDAAVLAAVFSLSNSEARRAANRAGARIISLPGCCDRTLVEGAIEAPFLELKPTIERLGAILSRSRTITVQNPSGSYLEIHLDGSRKSVDQTATAWTPGSWAPAPNLETAIGPADGGVDGVLVVDGVVIPGGIPSAPIRLEIENGKVTSIRGGADAERLSELLAGFSDPNMYRVVEFGIGMNPRSRLGLGLMAEDESKLGTAHFGLGEGRTFGVPVVAPSHVDLVIRDPIIRVDGRIIVANEKLDSSFGEEE